MARAGLSSGTGGVATASGSGSAGSARSSGVTSSSSSSDYASRMSRAVADALHGTALGGGGGHSPLLALVAQYATTKLLVSLALMTPRELALPLPAGRTAAQQQAADDATAALTSAAAAAAGTAATSTPAAASTTAATAPAATAAAPARWRSKRVQQLQEQQQQQPAAASAPASASASSESTAAAATATAAEANASAERQQPQRCVCVLRDAYTLDTVARFAVDDEPVAPVAAGATGAAAVAAAAVAAARPNANAYALDVWPAHCWIVVAGPPMLTVTPPSAYDGGGEGVPHWSRTIALYEYGLASDDGGHGAGGGSGTSGVSVRKVLQFVAPLRPFTVHDARSVEQRNALAALPAPLRTRLAKYKRHRGRYVGDHDDNTDDDEDGDDADADFAPMAVSLTTGAQMAWANMAQPVCVLQRAVARVVPCFATYDAYAAAVATDTGNPAAMVASAVAAAATAAAANAAAGAGAGSGAGAAGAGAGASASAAAAVESRVTLAVALLDHVLLYDVAGLLRVLAAQLAARDDADDTSTSADARVSLGVLNPIAAHWAFTPGYSGARLFVHQLLRQPQTGGASDRFATINVGGVARLWEPPTAAAAAPAASPVPASAAAAGTGAAAAAVAADAKGDAKETAQTAGANTDAVLSALFGSMTERARRDMPMSDVPNTTVWGGPAGWVDADDDDDDGERNAAAGARGSGGGGSGSGGGGTGVGTTLIGARYGQLFAANLTAVHPAAAAAAERTAVLPTTQQYSLRSVVVGGVSVVDLDARALFRRAFGWSHNHSSSGAFVPPTGMPLPADPVAAAAAVAGARERDWFRHRTMPVVLYPHLPRLQTGQTPPRQPLVAVAAGAADPQPLTVVRGLDDDEEAVVDVGARASKGAAAGPASAGTTASLAADDASPLALWVPHTPASGDAHAFTQNALLKRLSVRVVVPGSDSSSNGNNGSDGINNWRRRLYRLVRIDRDGSTVVAQRTGRVGLCVLHMQPPAWQSLLAEAATGAGVVATAPVLTYEVRAVTDTQRAQDYAFALAE